MIVLVLGGARSGKSAAAERLAAFLPQPVAYVATLSPDPSDADLGSRIASHRNRRPSHWTTVKAGADLPGLLRRAAGTVLVDSLGPWVAAHRPDDPELSRLTAALAARDGDTVVVSDEVGLSVHPSTGAGRTFRDDLGCANVAVADAADQVLLIVAGRVLKTEPFDPSGVLGPDR
jgi:adenosyl cobinamide kinase/adenosyl cobinamide phosphate guanylyltransferase